MDFCIDANQLRKALSDIEIAERNGFNYCLAVFKITQAGTMLDQCRADYSDLIEKAHPIDGKYDWGRFQDVSKKCRFENGKLIPIRD
jgi:hypothetical protein